MRQFFEFVEIRTKIASVFPFLFGTLYALYTYGQLKATETLLFFLSMLLFDMTTTAINNTVDSRSGHTILPYKRTTAVLLVLAMLAIATVLGILLALSTGPVVLLTGALCFVVGILYTFGPIPLSRMPLGEVFSGVFMGFFIPFLVVYVNAPPDALVTLAYTNSMLSIDMAIPALLRLAIASIPAVCTIAGVMLANNICDLEADRKVNRYTLPHYLGVRWSLILFAGLYAASFASIVAMAALRILPLYVLLVLAAALPVGKNVQAFFKRQSKPETFPLSVANLVWILGPLVLVTALAAWLR